MAGLCEGGNEPPGSLKAICKLISVDEIGDSEMIFGEMRSRIGHILSHIRLTIGENVGKLQPAGKRSHDRQKEGEVGRSWSRQMKCARICFLGHVLWRREERRESDRGREGRNPENSGGAIFWTSVEISSIVLSRNYGLVIKEERQVSEQLLL
ncbi:hypothetical protein ANN_11618 [Periplaneta americana]|uniref:Uncharacterized protein n=1 Tax=Periplaneta americana TaxID=6978 RepID=A0ABQ8T5I3_PERAM|nr:hypothetical protein ANN_11618 [Periplaneta americana]